MSGDTETDDVHHKRMRSTLRLVCAAALLMSGLGGCATPAGTRVASPALADDHVREVAGDWIQQHDGGRDISSARWSDITRDAECGEHRIVAFVPGSGANGESVVRRFVVDVGPEGVVRAWGPRHVGGGCTCHDPGEGRLK